MSSATKFLDQYVLGRPKKAMLLVPKKTDDSLALGSKLQQTVRNAKFAESMLRSSAKAGLNSFSDIKGVQSIQPVNGFNMIEVMYNPKSLDLRGLGGQSTTFSAGLGGMADNQVQQVKQNVSTTLSCELIFANVNTFNAFMLEGVNGLNFDKLGGIAASAINEIRGISYSVQPLLDGFIALLSQDYTRNVIFAWNNTIFRGELTRVDGSYKMFNTHGEPIVASVNIEIRQGDAAEFQYDETHWRNQFKATFKEPSL